MYIWKILDCQITVLKITLPCAWAETHGKVNMHTATHLVCRVPCGTRQMLRDPSSRYVFKCLPCVVHVAHGKTLNLSCVLFCRVFSCQAHGKQANLPCALCLPCVTSWAHGKWSLCRVPVFLLTANVRHTAN